MQYRALGDDFHVGDKMNANALAWANSTRQINGKFSKTILLTYIAREKKNSRISSHCLLIVTMLMLPPLNESREGTLPWILPFASNTKTSRKVFWIQFQKKNCQIVIPISEARALIVELWEDKVLLSK